MVPMGSYGSDPFLKIGWLPFRHKAWMAPRIAAAISFDHGKRTWMADLSEALTFSVLK
jgi:hypothetical protein